MSKRKREDVLSKIKRRRNRILSFLEKKKKDINELKMNINLNEKDILELHKSKPDWSLLFLYLENKLILHSFSKDFQKNLTDIEKKCCKYYVDSTYRYHRFVFLILEISLFHAIIFKNRMKVNSASRHFDYEESLYYFKRSLVMVKYLEKKKSVDDHFSLNLMFSNPTFIQYKSFILLNMGKLHLEGKRYDLSEKVVEKLENLNRDHHVLHLKFKTSLKKRQFVKADIVLNELGRYCPAFNIFNIWDKLGIYSYEFLQKLLISKRFDSKVTSLTQIKAKQREFERLYEDPVTSTNLHMVNHISKPAGVEYQKTPFNVSNNHNRHHHLHKTYLQSEEHRFIRQLYNRSLNNLNSYMELIKKTCGLSGFPSPQQMYQFLELKDLKSLTHFFPDVSSNNRRSSRRRREEEKKKRKSLTNVNEIIMKYIEGSMYYFLVKEQLHQLRIHREEKDFPNIRDNTDRKIRREMERLATLSLICFDTFWFSVDNEDSSLESKQRGEIFYFFRKEVTSSPLLSIPRKDVESWDGRYLSLVLRFLMQIRMTKSLLFRHEMRDYSSEKEEEIRERKELREKINFLRKKAVMEMREYMQFEMKVERLYNKFLMVTVGESMAKKRVDGVCEEKGWMKYFERIDLKKELGMSFVDFEDDDDDDVFDHLYGEEEEEEEEEGIIIQSNNNNYIDDDEIFEDMEEDELILDDNEDDEDDEVEIVRGKENNNNLLITYPRKKKKKKEEIHLEMIDLTLSSDDDDEVEEEEEEEIYFEKKKKKKKKKKKVSFKIERIPMKNKNKVSTTTSFFIQPPPPPPEKKKKMKMTKMTKKKKKKKKLRNINGSGGGFKKRNNNNNNTFNMRSSELYRQPENLWAVKKIGKKRKRRNMEFDSIQEEQEFHKRKKLKRNIV